MKASINVVAIFLAGLGASTPTFTSHKRSIASSCAQYGSSTAGAYTLYNNLWGESRTSSGSQCYTLDSTFPLGWTSTWTWSGGPYDVKSYANAVYHGYSSVQLSSISSIPTTWSWTYTGDDLVAGVSYDLFTSSTAGGSEEYEVMVWLASLGGAGPIASSYDASGKPVANGQLTVGGKVFNFYKGSNGVQN